VKGWWVKERARWTNDGAVGAAVLRVVTCCAVLSPRSVKGRKYLIGRLSAAPTMIALPKNSGSRTGSHLPPKSQTTTSTSKSQSEPPQLNKANKKTKTHELLFVGRSQKEGS
jgi:hypothetical protein